MNTTPELKAHIRKVVCDKGDAVQRSINESLERKYAKEIGEIKKEYESHRKYYDLCSKANSKKYKLITDLQKKTDYKSTINDNGRITANIDLYGKIDSIVNEILFTLQYRDNIDLAMIEKLTDAITEKELGKIRKS